MADIDKAELATQVLERLLVVAAGQTPAAADQALAEDEIGRAWGRLSKNGVAPFDVDSIPDEAQQQMRDYVGLYVAPSFGITGQRLLELRALSVEAEQALAQQFEDDILEDDQTDTNPDYY